MLTYSNIFIYFKLSIIAVQICPHGSMDKFVHIQISKSSQKTDNLFE